MEGFFRLVCEIALIVGVVAQRILTALATSIAAGIFQLVNNVVGGAGHKFAAVGQNVRESLSHALDYVVQGASALLRVFTYLWMFTAGVAKFFWTSLLDTVHMIANGIFNMISGMWVTLFSAIVSLSDKVLESAVLINLGAFQLVQSCVSDVCITIRRVSDGYFSYHSLESPSPPPLHPAAVGMPGAIACLSGGPSVASLSSSEESVSPIHRPPRHIRRAYTPNSYADAVAMGMGAADGGVTEAVFVMTDTPQQHAPGLRKRSHSHSPSFAHRAHAGCDDPGCCCCADSEGEDGAHIWCGDGTEVGVGETSTRRRGSGGRLARSGSRSPAHSAVPSRVHTPFHTTDEEDAKGGSSGMGAKPMSNSSARHSPCGGAEKQGSRPPVPAATNGESEGRCTPHQSSAVSVAQTTEGEEGGPRQGSGKDGSLHSEALAVKGEVVCTGTDAAVHQPTLQADDCNLSGASVEDLLSASGGVRDSGDKSDKAAGSSGGEMLEGMDAAMVAKMQAASMKKPLFIMRHLEQLGAERPDRKRSVSVG